MVELALIFPILALLVVGVADLARWYTSAIGIESAAREAADYGAYDESRWEKDPGLGIDNVPTTVAGMVQRACTAASTLPDYQGDLPGTPGMTCTNPTFSCELFDGANSSLGPCSAYDGNAGECAEKDPTTGPCKVTVTMIYTFNLFFGIPPMPDSILFDRKSTFAISDLQP